METLKDILLSIRDWFKDRVGNPFFASFLAAWLLLNWRVVLVLFSDLTALEKIDWIDNRLYPAWWHWTYFGLITPLCTAAFYVGLSPHVLRKVSVYCRKQQHKSTSEILKADSIQPLSPEMAERLIKERIRARLDLKTERTRFANLETEYLDQIEKLQDQLKPKPVATENETPDDQPNELNPLYELLQIGQSLSKNATEILDVAARSSRGNIQYRKTISAKILSIGSENLMPTNATAREIAAWEDALHELQEKRLIQEEGSNSYNLTKLGYDTYDALLAIVVGNTQKIEPA